MNQILEEYTFPAGQKLQVVQGDITKEVVDAIVNAANAQLKHGGGVAGVISQRGGPQIQAESDAWVQQNGPVSHAEPAFTSAGRLPCQYVIHAVGPVWGEGDEDAKLDAAVTGSLDLADGLNLDSVALPAISTGIFGFPKDRAARVIFHSIQRYIEQNPDTNLETVRLTLYDQPTVDIFLQVWRSEFDHS